MDTPGLIKGETSCRHKPESQVTILVIDDDAYIRDLIAQYLEYWAGDQLKMTMAASAESGLLEAQQNNFDVIILDWRLGIDGAEMVNRIHTITPRGRIPPSVVVISGDLAKTEQARALQAGAMAYLGKHGPFFKTLLAAVQNAWARHVRLERIVQEYIQDATTA